MTPNITNYEQALEYLFLQLPMYQRQGNSAFKKDLNNIIALCKHLEQPHEKFYSIHIAGTNGKGTVAHLLACLFQSRGFKVGLYTSPHYSDFRERIKINGEYIPQQKVLDFVQTHHDFFQSLQPSFFEITVALAFDYFAKEEVDIAIIETGLGGRLDSTNIINPILSVITNISYDHQNMLGDTLPEIAAEKAGIIKKEVPIVIGETQMKVKDVFIKKAKEQNAPIIFADKHYRAELKKEVADNTLFTIYRNGKATYNNLQVNLQGPFQKKNMATLLQAIETFNDLDIFPMIREYDMRNGLPKLKELTQYKGRWHRLQNKPTIICDSAHNEKGLQFAMNALQTIQYKNLHIVLGMVNDKEVEKMLKIFPNSAQYYFCKANIPRGLDACTLQQKAHKLGMGGECFQSVQAALQAAKKRAEAKDLIYVGGSTFVVAEVI